MMPEWFHPVLNESLAVGVVGFVCWLAAWTVKQFSPVVKQRIEAQAKRETAQADLAETLKVTQQQQTDLMGRSVAMLHDHGAKLDSHGNLLGRHGEKLEEHSHLLHEIRKQTARDCAALSREDRP